MRGFLGAGRRRAAADRAGAAADRAGAAADRAGAATDRLWAAADLRLASTERRLAALDRARAALDRELSESDDLTGVRRRGPGLIQLAKEIDRTRRASQPLALAFIDVDALKRVNDTQGHLAGDALLRSMADALRTRLRSYDLIIRVGGDEFVCALPDSNVENVRHRFTEAGVALAASPTGGSITVGYAQLSDGDSAEKLIARADADLLARRRVR